MNRFSLPEFKKLVIDEYSLYDSPLIIDFNKPLNIIFGTNGTGKSTLLLIMLYSILGPYKGGVKTKIYKDERKDNRPYYSEGFFRDRMLKECPNAKVKVEYLIGNDEYIVEHSLYEHKLLSVNVNGKEFQGKCISYRTYELKIQKNEQISEYLIYKYHQALEKSTMLPGGVNTLISMLIDIILFDEERRYKFWEPRSQNTVVGKYIVDAQYYEKYLEKQLDTKALESAYKKKSETLNFMSKFFESEKKNAATNKKKPLMDMHNELLKLDEELNQKEKIINEIKSEYKNENETLHTLTQNIEQIYEKLNSLDEIWYNNLFPNQYNIYYRKFHHKMIEDVCPLCEQNHIFNTKTDTCIFCDQKLNINKTPDLIEIDISRKDTQIELKRKNAELDLKKSENRDTYKKITDITKEYNLLVAKKKELEIELNIDNVEKQDEDERRLNEARKQKDAALSLFNKSKAELAKMEEYIETSLVDNFNLFSKRFRNYAKSFFGKEHEVRVKMPFSLSDTNDEHLIIQFELDGRVRSESYMLSESQRIFTDLSYRFAILNTFHDTSFFICETPDSTLDMFHEKNAVQTFKNYINDGNTLILTANARMSNLISTLYNEYDAKDINVVDLTNISKLSNNINISFEQFIGGRA